MKKKLSTLVGTLERHCYVERKESSKAVAVSVFSICRHCAERIMDQVY